MKYNPRSIAFTDMRFSPKLAALLYPRVFPIVSHREEMPMDMDQLTSILPEGNPASANPLYRSGSGFWLIFQMIVRAWLFAQTGDRDESERLCKFLETVLGVEAVSELRRHVEDRAWMARYLVNHQKAFGLNSSNFESIGGSSTSDSRDSLDDADPCLVLSKLEVVDADRLSWEQVLAIRADDQSARRLRRLRTFIFEEFDGRPLSYIEDRLGVLMDDYRAAARKHGVSLIRAALSAVSSEKVLMGGAAGILAAITGAAVPLAAAIGAVAALGNVLLEVRTARKVSEIEQSVAPVRFLIDIEKASNR